MPTTSETDGSTLFQEIQKASDNKIYTFIIGFGVDFNVELTKALSEIAGTSYFSVTSAKSFKEV